ncbi:MAG TPA: redoxin domain-containing protein [Candidatus Deferrimicrobium sp.]|nr:redoxin domain-containing protein [Candidatus Deferrimicrobium sp.]
MIPEVIKIRKNTAILIGLGIMVTGFVGVLAGYKFVAWRQGLVTLQSTNIQSPQEVGLFNRGEMFPDVKLVDLNGDSVNTHDFIREKKTVVMFLTVGCTPCTDAINLWKTYADRFPGNMLIVGICAGERESAKAYSEETGFPFSLYCDTDFTFMAKYKIRRFPSFVGLTENGVIAFLQHGFRADFDPLDVVTAISSNE